MAAPPFRRITIVGVGLIGGSLGLAARRADRSARVLGVDRPGVLRRACARGAVHAGTASLARGLRDAELVVLALPVDGIVRLLPRVARLAPAHAVITDVGGTKVSVLRAARRAGLEGRFIGGHPMAGSERSGVAHAVADLVRGAPWILCPCGDGRAYARVRRWVALLGARPVRLAAARHDEIAARLSHLPQLLSVALVNVAARGVAGGRDLRLAGPAFRQMSRLASSPPDLWRAILLTNRGPIARAVSDLVRELGRLRAGLGRGAAYRFRRAARARRGISVPGRRTGDG
ncbi:MAG: prephenate dehydrogenase [Acidobacteriota bacterium]